MAARFWIGGTASWDFTAGTKWSTSSGGASGAAVPTSADDVTIDSVQGAQTLTISGAQVCKSLTFTSGFTGAVAGVSTPAISVSGDITLSPNQASWASTGLTVLNANSTITSNGKSVAALTINANGFTVNLAGNIQMTGIFSLVGGTFNANTYNMTFSTNCTSTGSVLRTMNLGSGTWTFAPGGNANFTAGASGSNFTLTKGTAAMVIAPTIASTIFTFNGQGLVYNDLRISQTFRDSQVSFGTGSNTFANIDLSGTTVDGSKIVFPVSFTTTFTSFTPTTKAVYLAINPSGTAQATMSCASGSVNFGDYAWISDLNCTGGATEFYSKYGYDGGNNTGVRFYPLLMRGGKKVGA